jgi:hypothetical protein
VFLIRSIFLNRFLHGLLDPPAAADLGVAFFRAAARNYRLSHPVLARVVLAENLADLLGMLVRVASRDRF